MKVLPLLVLACALLTQEMARANPFRINCYVQEGALFVRCPTADRGWLKHQAAMYNGMFRGNAFPTNLKSGDPLSCSVDVKNDLTDCIVQK